MTDLPAIAPRFMPWPQPWPQAEWSAVWPSPPRPRLHPLRQVPNLSEAEVTVDGVCVRGSHEKFGLPKTLIAIGTGLSRHELRKLRVYEAAGGQSGQSEKRGTRK